MAWVSWDSLTQPKDKGGLGIREIQSFNEALLAKLSWRFINNPTSLLSRMLSAKYCRNKPFLEVNPKTSSSHGWKGMLVGRDLLLHGLSTVVGNGTTTSVWRDPWTTTIAPGLTIGPAPLHYKDMMVSDLIEEHSKEWNVELLKNLFPASWTEIMQIIPSKMNSPDKTVWLHTKDGIYSTRSGYYKALENKVGEKYETTATGFAWKKSIWNAKCPPKIQMLLWRAARGTLPVGTNLLRRKVTTTANCSLCGEEETDLHTLFHCPFAQEVWRKAPLSSPIDVNTIADMKNAISRSTSKQSLQQPSTSISVTAPWIIWAIWSSRNKRIFDNRRLSEEETIKEAISAEEEWKKAQLDNTLTPEQQQQQPTTARNKRQDTDQEDLQPDTIICQTDAAWMEQSKQAGLGWVTLNNKRRVQARNCKPVPLLRGPSEAEALCIFEALLSLQNHRDNKIIIESDAKNVISAIVSRKPPIHLTGIIGDILSLANSFRSLSFRFIPRSGNMLADDLAKTAVRSMILGSSTFM